MALLVSEETAEWQLQVPATSTKQMIGKNGHVVRELQKESGTAINVNRVDFRADAGADRGQQKTVIVFQHPRMHLPSLAKAVALTLKRFDKGVNVKLQFPIIQGITPAIKRTLDYLASAEGMEGVIAYSHDDPIAQDCVVLTGSVEKVRQAMFALLEQVLEIDMQQIDLKKLSAGPFGLQQDREKPPGAWVFYVSAASSRMIIGRQGQNIRHLRQISGAVVRVNSINPAAPDEGSEVGIWHERNDVAAVAMAGILTLDKISEDERIIVHLPAVHVSKDMVAEVVSKKKLPPAMVQTKAGMIILQGALNDVRTVMFQLVGTLMGRSAEDYGRVSLINFDTTLWVAEIEAGELGLVLGRGGVTKQEIQETTQCRLDIQPRGQEAHVYITTPDADIMALVKGAAVVLSKVHEASRVRLQFPRGTETEPAVEEEKEEDDEEDAAAAADGRPKQKRERTVKLPVSTETLQRFQGTHPSGADILSFTKGAIVLAGVSQIVRDCLTRLFNVATGLHIADTVAGQDLATAWYFEVPRRAANLLMGKKMQSIQRIQEATGARLDIQYRKSTALCLVSIPDAAAAAAGSKGKPVLPKAKKELAKIARAVLMALDHMEAPEVTVQVPGSETELDAAHGCITDGVTVTPQPNALHLSGSPAALRATLLELLRGAFAVDISDVDRRWALSIPRAVAGPAIGRNGAQLQALESAYPTAEVFLSNETMSVLFAPETPGATALSAFHFTISKIDFDTDIAFTVPVETAHLKQLETFDKGRGIMHVNASGRFVHIAGPVGTATRALHRVMSVMGVELEGPTPVFSALRWLITIPRAASGRLIGKGGACIQEVRDATGAKLSMKYAGESAALEVNGHGVEVLAKATVLALNKLNIGDVPPVVTVDMQQIVESLDCGGDVERWVAGVQTKFGLGDIVAARKTSVLLQGPASIVQRALVAVLAAGGWSELAAALPAHTVLQWKLELAPESVGLIIGARGASIKAIESATSTHLSCPKGGKDVTIEGSVASIVRAVLMSLEKLDEGASVVLSFPMIGPVSPEVISGLDEVGRPDKARAASEEPAAAITHTSESVTITGNPTTVEASLLEVLGKVFNLDTEAFDTDKPSGSGWQMELPRKFIGKIVGKAGKNQRRLETLTGLRIGVKYRKTAVLVVLSTKADATESAENTSMDGEAGPSSAAAEGATGGGGGDARDEVIGKLLVGGTLGVEEVRKAGKGSEHQAASETLRFVQAARLVGDMLTEFATVKLTFPVREDVRDWISRQQYENKTSMMSVSGGSAIITGACPDVLAALTRVASKMIRSDVVYLPTPLAFASGVWALQAPHDAAGLILGKGGRNKIEIQESTGANLEVSTRGGSTMVTYTGKEDAALDPTAVVRAMVQTLNNLLNAKDKNTTMSVDVQLGVGSERLIEMEHVVRRTLPDPSSYATYNGDSIIITGQCTDIRSCLVGSLSSVFGDAEAAGSLAVITWHLQISTAVIPLVVGKGGASIRSVEQTTGVRISVDQKGAASKDADIAFSLPTSADQNAMLKAISSVLQVLAERATAREAHVVLTVPRTALKKGSAMVRKTDEEVVYTDKSVTVAGLAAGVRDSLYTTFGPVLHGASESALTPPVTLFWRREGQWAMEIPQARLGRIIGKSGAQLKEIREKSKCRVEIPDVRTAEARSEDSILLFKGDTPLSVVRAVALTVDRLLENDAVQIQFPLELADEGKEVVLKKLKSLTGRGALESATLQCDEKTGLIRGTGPAARALLLRAMESLGRDIGTVRKEISDRERMYKVEIAHESVGIIVGKGGAAIKELERLNGGKVEIDRGKDSAELLFGSPDMDVDQAEAILLYILDRLDVREYVRVHVPTARTDRAPFGARFVDLRQAKPGEFKEDIIRASADLAVVSGQAGHVRVAITAYVSRLKNRDLGRAEVLVHPDYLGVLIGKNGDNVRLLEGESGASVHINRSKNRSERFLDVSLSGSQDAVVKVLGMIADRCEDWRPEVVVHGFSDAATPLLVRGNAPPAPAAPAATATPAAVVVGGSRSNRPLPPPIGPRPTITTTVPPAAPTESEGAEPSAAPAPAPAPAPVEPKKEEEPFDGDASEGTVPPPPLSRKDTPTKVRGRKKGSERSLLDEISRKGSERSLLEEASKKGSERSLLGDDRKMSDSDGDDCYSEQPSRHRASKKESDDGYSSSSTTSESSSGVHGDGLSEHQKKHIDVAKRDASIFVDPTSAPKSPRSAKLDFKPTIIEFLDTHCEGDFLENPQSMETEFKALFSSLRPTSSQRTWAQMEVFRKGQGEIERAPDKARTIFGWTQALAGIMMQTK